MKNLYKLAVCLVVASALQSCSSSSDMGEAMQEPASGALQPGTVQPSNHVIFIPEVVAAVVDNAVNVACEASAEEFRDTMLAVINNSRQNSRMCGTENRQPVKLVGWNNQLAAAALSHAQDMKTENFFHHNGSDGLEVEHRAEAAGYDWKAIGENIAAGQLEMQEVHQSWLDSAGHCQNIMSPLYAEVGAACLDSPDNEYGTYWVVVFGDRL